MSECHNVMIETEYFTIRRPGKSLTILCFGWRIYTVKMNDHVEKWKFFIFMNI